MPDSKKQTRRDGFFCAFLYKTPGSLSGSPACPRPHKVPGARGRIKVLMPAERYAPQHTMYHKLFINKERNLPVNFISLVKEYQNRCIKKRDSLTKLCSSLPDGKLFCSKSNGYDIWRYSTETQKSVYIPKSGRAFARELALQNYYTAQILDLDAEIRACEKFLDHIRIHAGNYEALMAGDNPEFKKLLGEILKPDNEKFEEWAKAPYDKADFYTDRLKFTTSAGYKVRSKGEVLIAQELYAMKIPVRYEEKKYWGNDIVVPDFTILCPVTGTEKLIEYCGMMDVPKYRKRYLEKLQIYMANGFSPDENLLLIHENTNSPIDINVIRQRLQQFIFGLA